MKLTPKKPETKNYEKFKGSSRSKQHKKQLSIDSSRADLNHNKSFSTINNKSFFKNSSPNYSFTSFRNSVLGHSQSEKITKQNKNHYTFKEVKKIIEQLFLQIRNFLDDISKDFERLLENTKRKFRKDFQDFLREGIPKKCTLTTKPSDQTTIPNFPIFKIKHIDSFQKQEEISETNEKNSMKNPLKVKKKVQESANLNNSHAFSKNSCKQAQRLSKRVSKIYETPQRQNKERSERQSASKEVMKLQQRLSSLKSMLNN